VTVYEALSGALPAQAGNLHEWIVALLQWSPVPLSQRCPDLPAAATDAVMKAMSAQPHARFTSCSEFAKALAAATVVAPHVAPKAAATPIAAPAPAAAKPPHRSRWPWLVVAVVVFGAGFAWWATQRGSSSPTAEAPSAS